MFKFDYTKSLLCVLIGLPGVGKSTIANALQNNFQLLTIFRQIKCIDPDKFRSEIMGNEFNPELENEVRKMKMSLVNQLLEGRSLVIVDDTNYYSSMRQDLRKIAKKKKANYITVFLNAPLDYCLKKNRSRTNPIDDGVIRKIAARFDIPGEKYAWDNPVITLNPSRLSSDLMIRIVTHGILQKLISQQLYESKNDDTPIKIFSSAISQEFDEFISDTEKKEFIELRIRKFFNKILSKTSYDNEIQQIQSIANIDKSNIQWKSRVSELIVPLKNSFGEFLIKNQNKEPSWKNFIEFLKQTYAN